MKKLFWILAVVLLSGCSFRDSDWFASSGDGLIPPGTHSRSVFVDGYQRTYLLHVPDCIDQDQLFPLVIMYHGGGGTAQGVKRDTGWSDLADQACFLVAYPDGLAENPDRRSSFLFNPQVWNDGSGRFNQQVNDLDFTSVMIQEIDEDFKIDPGRVYAAGFSNGASMAFQVGVKMNQVFAAIAPVSGALWYEGFSLEEPVSLLYMTGTEDPLNPLEGGQPRLATGKGSPGGSTKKPPVAQHIKEWTRALGCNPDPEKLATYDIVEAVVYRDCEGDSEVIFYTLEGVGHHWPGGKIRLPEKYAGKPTDVIQATEIIWDFFSTHPKSE